MNKYLITQASQLSDADIKTILNYWDVEAWKDLQAEQFKQTFEHSEFHLLLNSQSDILCLSRINFDFCLQIAGTAYAFAEFVGFVSAERSKGYGTSLLYAIISNLKQRGIEAVGFCEEEIRGFYQKTKLNILYGQAKYLREFNSGHWIPSTDNDILDLTLSVNNLQLLQSLNSQKLAYIQC